jgi:large subunit ribosomal protein L10
MLKDIVSRDLNERFEGIEGFVVVDPQGLNSSETFDLRKSLREAGVRLQVVPNRLARRALAGQLGNGDGGGADLGAALEEIFKGPTALVVGEVSDADAVIAAAKAVATWRKKNKSTKVTSKGGALSGRVLSSEAVDQLAEIPDTKALYAQVAGLFQAPIRNLATATQQIIARVVYALQAIKEKRESEGQD